MKTKVKPAETCVHVKRGENMTFVNKKGKWKNRETRASQILIVLCCRCFCFLKNVITYFANGGFGSFMTPKHEAKGHIIR